MQPRPIRMPDSLWDQLESEAERHDLSTAAYIRRILRNRPDTQADTDAVVDRLDELERRIEAIETAPDTQPVTDPDATDYEPDTQAATQAITQPDASGEYGEQNAVAVETVRGADDPLRKAEIVEAVEAAVGMPIKADSWWVRHGRPAIRDAGAEQVGKKWKL